MNNVSEHFIFEVWNSLQKSNLDLSKDELYESLSKVVTNYEITKVSDKVSENDLQPTIDLFISGKKLEGLSDTTIDGYKIHLRDLNKRIHKDIENITTADLRVYLGNFSHLKQSSLASKISVLKTFFGWLFSEEIIVKDPTLKIKTPKFNKNNPKFLNVDELEMLRETCDSLRQRALIEVLYATGLRLSELHRMNIKDIDSANFSATVIGKGQKEREVLFSVKAIHHLKRYLNSRNDDCDALFVTERKPYRRLTKRGIQREIGKIASKLGIDKNITPHVLRHTLASLSLNNNMDISVISKLLGHSDVRTTQIYAHVTDENKRYQYKKHLVL
ncbi:site-specific tyrosine recombinase/integron integrase [Bacillus sp. AG4(2022)]|uniref:site-specific tyrosine recombinase/integron integrase n=1 Tax=Bacillus sp. AG4(2022) TaxID=2962594 RepID=UPI002881D1C6|nr:site-specific tyrosine recombinase/integron integrase [Bacillus sp. AG4(2022)]MDT0160250.1 tyrosine-type recombinase/integrase [Bacillus sp. AG4(2022)]